MSVRLPSGHRITVFFYDGPISRAVAFEGLLKRGEDLAVRLASGFRADRSWTQLMHIATDGETCGYHHRFGDWPSRFALHHVEKGGLAQLTNYGEFLRRFPPTHEVKIEENTSWSCAHGIERWHQRLRVQLPGADTGAGTRHGGVPCATRWTGCVMNWPGHMRERPVSISTTPGRPGTITSM